MAVFKVGAKVVLRGEVIKIDGSQRLIRTQCERQNLWIYAMSLESEGSPIPVTVRCDKCGIERPLTDFKTARDRCDALGVTCGDVSLRAFVRVCAELKEKGITAEEVVEGL